MLSDMAEIRRSQNGSPGFKPVEKVAQSKEHALCPTEPSYGGNKNYIIAHSVVANRMIERLIEALYKEKCGTPIKLQNNQHHHYTMPLPQGHFVLSSTFERFQRTFTCKDTFRGTCLGFILLFTI